MVINGPINECLLKLILKENNTKGFLLTEASLLLITTFTIFWLINSSASARKKMKQRK